MKIWNIYDYLFILHSYTISQQQFPILPLLPVSHSTFSLSKIHLFCFPSKKSRSLVISIEQRKVSSISLGTTFLSRLDKATHKRKRKKKKSQAQESDIFSNSHCLDPYNSTKLDNHNIYVEIPAKTCTDLLVVVSVSVRSYKPWKVNSVSHVLLVSSSPLPPTIFLSPPLCGFPSST
jgi:hypothetical protein